MVRIVAGEFKGRTLRVASGRETRPTSERARSGLFDWLGPELRGSAVLDLYAGSGALGIEALSRGAQRAVFIEKQRSALRCLRQNLEGLKLEARSQVIPGDALAKLRGLSARAERFGLILADPPYQEGEWERLAREPALAELLDVSGQVVVEHSSRDREWPDPVGLVHRDRKLYGETAFERYTRT